MSASRDGRMSVDAEGNATIDMGGVKLRVVDAAECERASFVVCAESTPEIALVFPDNVSTTCALCGRAICHRPSAAKTPPKICMPCAQRLPEVEDLVALPIGS